MKLRLHWDFDSWNLHYEFEHEGQPVKGVYELDERYISAHKKALREALAWLGARWGLHVTPEQIEVTGIPDRFDERMREAARKKPRGPKRTLADYRK